MEDVTPSKFSALVCANEPIAATKFLHECTQDVKGGFL